MGCGCSILSEMLLLHNQRGEGKGQFGMVMCTPKEWLLCVKYLELSCHESKRSKVTYQVEHYGRTVLPLIV